MVLEGIVASKLVLLDKDGARSVDATSLPQLIEDARDDADALAALVEVALDVGGAEALSATSAALARLRALESPRAAELSAQVGIALIAARDIDANAGIAGAPVNAPIWADVIAGTSQLIASPTTKIKGRSLAKVALFAFSDESSSSAQAAAGPTTPAGALTRGVPLALAEHLLPYAESVVTAPVVEAKGFYVAKSAWSLPEVLALSPLAEANPGYVVTGRIKRIEPFAIEIDVWDLNAGALLTRKAAAHDDEHVVITELAATIADAVSGRKPSAKKSLPPRMARAVRDNLLPARETRAHLEALAHVHALLLGAAGVLDVRELVNVDVALAALRDLQKADASLRAQLGLAAFIVVAIASGIKLDESARNEARAITDRLRTSASRSG